MSNLQERIVEYVTPLYAQSDKAHLIGHAHEVWANCQHIAKVLEKEKLLKVLHLAAYMHDMACAESRENHHIIARDFIKSKAFPFQDDFTSSEILDVAYAVESHRASWKAGYVSLTGEILAMADRGPLHYEPSLLRSYHYGISKLSLSHNDAIKHAYDHLTDKFSVTKGYNTRTELYSHVYRTELAEFDRKLKHTTLKQATEIIEMGLE